MRKQDRIAQQQSRAQEPPKRESRPDSKEKESGRIKGSTSEPQRPPRQSGKLPLPE